MKALRMVAVDRSLELQDIPPPTLDPKHEKDFNQVIVRVRACGVCGTDIHHLKGTARVSHLPITLGHEIAGEIHEVGKGVLAGRLQAPMFEPGNRVVVHNVIYCGECHYCRRWKFNFCLNQLMIGRNVDGGLAEYVKVPVRNLVSLPDEITMPEGAVLGCAGATAFHALRIAHIAVTDSVVVWGVGGVGACLVNLVREVSGAHPIIAVDRKDGPLELARELGADFTINSRREDPVQRIRDLTDGEGADVVLDTAGITQTTEDGTVITLESTSNGGRLIVVATYRRPIKIQPHDELGIFEKRFTGSCGNLPDELEKLTELVAGRRRLSLEKLISRIVSMEDAPKAVEEWRRKGGVPRIVVTM